MESDSLNFENKNESMISSTTDSLSNTNYS
jgi:hypothetical protein